MNGRHAYDLCVIGAGSAGYAAAVTAHGLGKSVVIVETDAPLGGLCILRGCMPSKTLLRSAEIAHLVDHASEVGVEAGPARPDVRRIVERKRRIIKGFADYRIEGIERFPVIRGAPRFDSRQTVRVGEETVAASKFIVATGSVTHVIPIPGIDEAGFLTSDEILELEEPPKSMIVLGGGPIACELAQYLQRVGVRVTLLQRSTTLLSGEDADIAASLRASLEREGMEIVTGTKVLRAEKSASGKRVRYLFEGVERSVEADEIFMALGRRANVDGLALEAAGVEYGKEGIKVDEALRTSNPDVYAVGDVIDGSTQLVHVAVLEGQTAARNAFGTGAPETIDYTLQGARAVFTDPQVAVAGLTERECVERGIPFAVASYPFDDLGKAIAANLTEGFVKMLASPEGRILGVSIIGAEASDLVHESIALLYFKADVRDVLMMPHLHPTLAEILTYPAEELCERLENERRALVTP